MRFFLLVYQYRPHEVTELLATGNGHAMYSLNFLLAQCTGEILKK